MIWNLLKLCVRLAERPASSSRALRAHPCLEELELRLVPSGVPTPAHVVLVIEENHSFADIIGSSSAPYINSLAQ
jgi:phosphatidylinositol-3-phosphatase